MLDDSNKIWSKTKGLLGFLTFLIPSNLIKQYLNIENTHLFKLFIALLVFTFLSVLELNERNKKIKKIERENDKLKKGNKELKEENKELNKFYEKHIASKTEYIKNSDSKILNEIKDVLYKSEVMYLMKYHDFNSVYERGLIDPLINYHEKSRNDPEFKFMDSELNALEIKLNNNVAGLLQTLGKYSQPLDVNPNFSTIPKDWELKNPELFEKAVSTSNSYADEISKTYEKLISLAREKQLTL